MTDHQDLSALVQMKGLGDPGQGRTGCFEFLGRAGCTTVIADLPD
jgi:hypothetical protein